jgi:hypothetical protein
MLPINNLDMSSKVRRVGPGAAVQGVVARAIVDGIIPGANRYGFGITTAPATFKSAWCRPLAGLYYSSWMCGSRPR